LTEILPLSTQPGLFQINSNEMISTRSFKRNTWLCLTQQKTSIAQERRAFEPFQKLPQSILLFKTYSKQTNTERKFLNRLLTFTNLKKILKQKYI
jgi:hypothetical protein